MATHDYVIDNSTGANVRADINNALAAIVSNNSSSSQPTTRYAYMWWADTTTGILKIRNSANDGWVELLQLDGTLTLEDGSASTPGLAFRDDLNTGIFSSAADTFNAATGGVERMELSSNGTIFNEDGADVDFRIEGDTEANLFYVDAGNDRIGISTSSPQSLLEIDSNDATFALKLTCNENVSGSYNGLSIAGNDENSGSYPLVVVSNSTTHETGGHPVFCCNSRNVGIGTLSPNTNLHIQGSNSGGDLEALRLHNNNTASGTKTTLAFTNTTDASVEHAKLTATRDNSGRLDFFVGAQSHAVLCVDGFGSGVVGVNTVQAAVALDVNGQIRTNNGILFGTDTASANTLHDYEEGDFTFHLRSEGGTNASMSGRVGRYVKIGQTVHIIGGGQYSGDPDNRSASNAIEFTNLPFTNVSTGLGGAGLPFPVQTVSLSDSGMSSMNGSKPYTFVGRLDNNATSGRIIALKGDGNHDPQNASLACVNNTQLYVMFTYQTTA